MDKLFFVLLSIIFIYCFVRIELYFIYMSIERFRELKEAYIDFKKSERELKEFSDDKK